MDPLERIMRTIPGLAHAWWFAEGICKLLDGPEMPEEARKHWDNAESIVGSGDCN